MRGEGRGDLLRLGVGACLLFQRGKGGLSFLFAYEVEGIVKGCLDGVLPLGRRGQGGELLRLPGGRCGRQGWEVYLPVLQQNGDLVDLLVLPY